MESDFDEDIDFDLDDDSDDVLIDLEDLEDGYDSVEVRTAVLKKDQMVALLCLKRASAGAAICRVDPRETNPAVQLYDDPAAALEWFTKSLRTSRQNGWSIIYDGLPLQG